MPNPEPTLAEICKTVRKLEAAATEAEARIRAVTNPMARKESDWERDGGAICHLLDYLRNHALALVQAAEQGERYRKALVEIAAPDSNDRSFGVLRDGDRIVVTDLASVRWRMDSASQALTYPSGAPPSIRVTLGGTTNPNEAARGGSST